jgi:hypothetical protein
MKEFGDYQPSDDVLSSVETREDSALDRLELAENSVGRLATEFVRETERVAADCLASDSEDSHLLGQELSTLAAEARERTAEAILELRELARLPPASAEEIRALFEKEGGVVGHVVKIPNGVEFGEAVIFPRSATQAEPLVRVFRGVNQLDRSLLRQVPYGIRSRSPSRDGELRILEGARESMLALAENPTHENLIRYAEAARPGLLEEEKSRFDHDLEDVENEVLSGVPLRRSLAFKTFQFNGGLYADTGIPPYLSVSRSPIEAATYGRNGMIVMDIPISKLEPSVGQPDGEVVLKGEIDARHIVAVLPRGYSSRDRTSEEIFGYVAHAVDTVDQEVVGTIMTPEEVRCAFYQERGRLEKMDDAQRESDVRSIRESRANCVLNQYADIGVTRADIEDTMRRESVDLYTAAKRTAYDRLADKFESLDPRNKRSSLEDRYVFSRMMNSATWSSQDLHYLRVQASDEMLVALRNLVSCMERRARGE